MGLPVTMATKVSCTFLGTSTNDTLYNNTQGKGAHWDLNNCMKAFKCAIVKEAELQKAKARLVLYLIIFLKKCNKFNSLPAE